MGRPSLAKQRRRQILEALAACIREKGYEATTLDSIACRAGVQRTLIRHYFGNRDDLLAAAVSQLTDNYRNQYLSLSQRLPARQRVKAMLDYLFGGDFNRHQDDDAVIDALVVTSSHNHSARNCLRKMYKTFEQTCYDEIVLAHPQAPRRRAKQVAYAIMCLAEQNSTLLSLGFEKSRSHYARAAAETLIGSLFLEHSSNPGY